MNVATVRRTEGTQFHALRRQQEGWLAEQAIDRAVLAGSRGRLAPFLPVSDTHRVDRAYSWDGIGIPQFVQIKTSSQTIRPGVYSFGMSSFGFVAYDRFWLAACTFDKRTAQVGEVGWLIPTKTFVQLAGHYWDEGTRTSVYHWDPSLTGNDKFAQYRHRLEEFPSVLVSKDLFTATRPRVPSGTEQGAIYEAAFVAELVRGAVEDLVVYRPASDLSGRDFLVQMANTPRALFIQVKGTALASEGGALSVKVPRVSLHARADTWLALYYFDPAEQALFQECWLVPSLEFRHRTRQQRGKVNLNFAADLDPGRDKWREYRHPLRSQADVFRAELKSLPI